TTSTTDAESAETGDNLLFQESLFIEQLKIAHELKRPVSLHCVRAWDSMERHVRHILGKNSSLPLLFHGFTGSPELVRQILTHWKLNAYFSLTATRFRLNHPRSLQLLHTIPHDRLFLETDAEKAQSVKTLPDFYHKISIELNLLPDSLCDLIRENQQRFLSIN
ncbi:MAG: TatD family hydrolase, partial [Planctomycetia bacterium]|nr:TatD family hydrolase [Planctomycetia bacterium]